MLDYTPQITNFLKSNFKPSNVENATHKLATYQLLGLLFNVFPNDCIDDYELNQILTNLQYQPFKISEEVEENGTNKEVLKFVWCLTELSEITI